MKAYEAWPATINAKNNWFCTTFSKFSTFSKRGSQNFNRFHERNSTIITLYQRCFEIVIQTLYQCFIDTYAIAFDHSLVLYNKVDKFCISAVILATIKCISYTEAAWKAALIRIIPIPSEWWLRMSVEGVRAGSVWTKSFSRSVQKYTRRPYECVYKASPDHAS